ncbi:hypothetical protein NE237_002136 [Protea cynaroides]|uniref:Uncharacterized protein n=1 Tax=Protea cynaroides TaxID=273540 RepID=A0A9Q0KUM8_9MAGN|nr:hypothetical protein NE237_002136 [Protea cynaroides]
MTKRQAESSDSKGTKKDFSAAILERKKAANRLVVDEAVNDDNSVVTMNPETMEKLQLFRGDTILIKLGSIYVVHSLTDCLSKVRKNLLNWVFTKFGGIRHFFQLLSCGAITVGPIYLIGY